MSNIFDKQETALLIACLGHVALIGMNLSTEEELDQNEKKIRKDLTNLKKVMLFAHKGKRRGFNWLNRFIIIISTQTGRTLPFRSFRRHSCKLSLRRRSD